TCELKIEDQPTATRVALLRNAVPLVDARLESLKAERAWVRAIGFETLSKILKAFSKEVPTELADAWKSAAYVYYKDIGRADDVKKYKPTVQSSSIAQEVPKAPPPAASTVSAPSRTAGSLGIEKKPSEEVAKPKAGMIVAGIAAAVIALWFIAHS